jgi:hypothetical protein
MDFVDLKEVYTISLSFFRLQIATTHDDGIAQSWDDVGIATFLKACHPYLYLDDSEMKSVCKRLDQFMLLRGYKEF